MYILTEENQIINTQNYRLGFEGITLYAYSMYITDRTAGQRILIARFGNETEAETATKDIFNAIYQKDRIWSAAEYIDELEDTPSEDATPDEIPVEVTIADDTAMSDWTKWEQDVAQIIIEL